MLLASLLFLLPALVVIRKETVSWKFQTHTPEAALAIIELLKEVFGVENVKSTTGVRASDLVKARTERFTFEHYTMGLADIEIIEGDGIRRYRKVDLH
jgi:hypothetical protein